jgi:gentisate 1,2-dioxygenase
MENTRIYEYTSAANPFLSNVPIEYHDSDKYENCPTSIIPFDNKEILKTDYQATTPSLLASFVKIQKNHHIFTDANTTSHFFYVSKGAGLSIINNEEIYWVKGDIFVVPHINSAIKHISSEDTLLLWVTDEPLLSYLGVRPLIPKFEFALFKHELMMNELNRIRIENQEKGLNRLGILLGNKDTETSTKTITHTLWSLLNVLPANTVQKPHRHNSVALDLCTFAYPGNNGEKQSEIYTLIGDELDENGNVKNPIKCYWKTGTLFITPPGLWHSHHNETEHDAYVLPIQDAGLYTYLRTLDIRFS